MSIQHWSKKSPIWRAKELNIYTAIAFNLMEAIIFQVSNNYASSKLTWTTGVLPSTLKLMSWGRVGNPLILNSFVFSLIVLPAGWNPQSPLSNMFSWFCQDIFSKSYSSFELIPFFLEQGNYFSKSSSWVSILVIILKSTSGIEVNFEEDKYHLMKRCLMTSLMICLQWENL